MLAQLIPKWGAIGAYAFVVICCLGMVLATYSLWDSIRGKLRAGRIEVFFYGQHDESVHRTRNSFKFWFVIAQLALALVFCAGAFVYFLVELVRDATARL